MGPTSSSDAVGRELSSGQRALLTDVARRSIAYGLAHGEAMPVVLSAYADALREPKACFVTLRIGEELRGCVGTLRARLPLVEEVARSAYSAAFGDPRFPPLTAEELDTIHLHISVLSTPEPMPVADEGELLARLRPGVDGLVLSDGARSSTFLPSVWDSLPEPKRFVTHLKLKAGMPPDHWSSSMRVQRYTTESFEEAR
jgi:AmmeMemoRadiSam system protein A